MPRSRSSGALSIESNDRNVIFGLCFDSTFVIAAVNVVLPWSMCPIVPTFTCGFERSNFSFAISSLSSQSLRHSSNRAGYKLLTLVAADDLFRDRPWRFFVAVEVHRVVSAALGRGAHVRGIAKHFAQRHIGLDDL